MNVLSSVRYVARPPEGAVEYAAMSALRYASFRADGPDDLGQDRDSFDDYYGQMVVIDRANATIVGAFRYVVLTSGRELAPTYSAQFYDLSRLMAYPAPLLEIGRLCMAPSQNDPDIVRAVWGAIAALVERHGVGLVFGCSSFAGTDAEPYRDAFNLLLSHHQAPACWRPQVCAKNHVGFAQAGQAAEPDFRRAMQALPTLLRGYLSLGGWVSDHAVLDFDLNNLHVFTGVEVENIPPARKKFLKSISRR